MYYAQPSVKHVNNCEVETNSPYYEVKDLGYSNYKYRKPSLKNG